MAEHKPEKLLAGFAADTLTLDERQALYIAALKDQQVFNALADEQALKELLADPLVRARLLQTLRQPRPSISEGSLSWLHWFRRPAGFAFAGGLAAAGFAVVLGTKIYQDSLKQVAPSVTTEESKPASLPPPTGAPASPPALSEPVEPEPKAKEDVPPSAETAKKDVFADRIMKQGQDAPPKSKKERTPSADPELGRQRTGQEGVSRQTETPAIGLGKAADELTASADQKRSEPSAPPPVLSEASPSLQSPPPEPAGGVVAQRVSARALFYAAEPGRSDQRIVESEKEQNLKSAQEARRSPRTQSKIERFAAADTRARLKPLGLRYGFAIRTPDGKAQETDVATALKSGEQARLTIQVNQDAYVQIWKRGESTGPELWLPEKDTGQSFVKVSEGRRQGVLLSTENEAFTLTVRVSRVPFGPSTGQEDAMLDSPPLNQLKETIAPHDPPGSQEQATYVVNQNPSPTAQIVAEISLGR